jgi:hypothetical protein
MVAAVNKQFEYTSFQFVTFLNYCENLKVCEAIQLLTLFQRTNLIILVPPSSGRPISCPIQRLCQTSLEITSA